MNRQPFAGGGYADALPNGARAVLFPGSHIDTHIGRVPLPGAGEDVLYLRIASTPRFMIAGQGHDSGIAWLWDVQGQAWRDTGPSFGVSPLVFGNGKLYVVRDAAHYDVLDLASGTTQRVDRAVGSQGFRYVGLNGEPVTGDETYADATRKVWEYTVLGPLVIGQGETGAHVLFGSDHHLLEDGDTRFIRASMDGGTVAIAIVKLAEQQAVLIQAGIDELLALPAPGAPPPVTPPVQPPDPPKEPPVSGHIVEGISDAQFATLQAERAKYGATVTPVEIAAILNATCYAHRSEGLGMQAKPGSTTVRWDGTPIWNGLRGTNSHGEHFGQDVLEAATVGRATPNRAEAIEIVDGDPPFIAPIPPANALPKEPPVSSVDDVTITEIRAQIADLVQRVTALENPKPIPPPPAQPPAQPPVTPPPSTTDPQPASEATLLRLVTLIEGLAKRFGLGL